MAQFGNGNRAARGKHSRIGPRLVKLPHRNGWYIKYYASRANILSVTCLAELPHGLALREESRKGLVVIDTPVRGSQYRPILQAGDAIVRVGNTKVATVAEFERVLSENIGKTLNLSVNKGGKVSTQAVVEKAGRTREEAAEHFRKWERRNSSDPGEVLERNVLFSRLAEEFLIWARTAGGYSSGWLKEVTRTMTVHRNRWGGMTLEQMTPRLITTWITERLDAVSWNTFMNEFKPLRVAFGLAVKQWRYLKMNPTADLKVRERPQSLPKYLEEEQVDELIKAARVADGARLKPGKSPKGGAAVSCVGVSPTHIRRCYNADGTFDTARIRFLLLTALRKSQLVDLKWANYDKERGTLTLQTTEGHSEKSRRVTVIPIPDAAKKIIVGQPRNSEFIFPNLKRGRDTEIAIRFRRIAAVAEAACGRHMHLHMLRHTALTHLLKHSQNIAAVSRYAGHADVKTTQIYAHVLDDQLREITKGFDITRGAQATLQARKSKPCRKMVATPAAPTKGIAEKAKGKKTKR